MVAVLTLDWDTCLMTGSEGALNDGLPMIGASGAIHDVLESDGVETYRFHSARSESHVSKLQKRRTLVRKLLTEFTIGEEATSPRQRPQLGRPDLPPVAESASETANTPADCVWVLRGDGQVFAAGTIAEPPHGGSFGHGRMLHPVSGSLLELVRVDDVESFARRLRPCERPHAGTPATHDQPHDGRASNGASDFIAELGRKQPPILAPDTVDHSNEEEDRIDFRVLPITRDKAGVRQRSFAEAYGSS